MTPPLNPHRGSDFNGFLIEQRLMTPTRREITAHLHKWAEIYLHARAAWASLEGAIGQQFDSPLHRAVWNTFDAYTDALAELLGDRDGWLDWFCWANEMGAKAGEVTINGKKRKARTVRDLSWILSQP